MKQAASGEPLQTKNDASKIAAKRYRIGAFLIDFLIYWLIGMLVGMYFGTPNNEGGYTFSGLPAFGMICLALFLWPISEGLWGQTIGKRFLDLKVVTDDFKPIAMGQAFGRFFLGIVDYILLIGLIVAGTNKQNKRIGDLVANTVVIRAKWTE